MQVFQEYQKLMEAKIEEFLHSEGCTPEQLYKQCTELRDSGHCAWATCIDYLSSCLEYEDFMKLVQDFRSIGEWEMDESCACELGLE